MRDGDGGIGPWIYDVLLRLKLTTAERHMECKTMLDRIASMLVKMAKNLQVNA